MKKTFRFLSMLLTVVMFMSVWAAIPVNAASNDLTVKVDGSIVKFPDQKPVAKNNRTLVPVRFIAENLGYKVEWNQKEQAAVIDGGRIKLYVNSNKVVIDGKSVTLDVKTEVINERTMVPLRVVAETLNCTVDWVPTNKMILVNKRSADGKELSVFERFYQTDLFWREDYENSKTSYLTPKANQSYKDAVAGKWTAWRILGECGYDETAEFQEWDCSIMMHSLDKKYINQVKDLLYTIYPTQTSEAYDIMMQVVREQLWEGFYKPSDKLMYLCQNPNDGPGTFGKHMLDNRTVQMQRDYQCTTLAIVIYEEGFVYPYTPRELTKEEIESCKESCYPWDMFFGDK